MLLRKEKIKIAISASRTRGHKPSIASYGIKKGTYLRGRVGTPATFTRSAIPWPDWQTVSKQSGGYLRGRGAISRFHLQRARNGYKRLTNQGKKLLILVGGNCTKKKKRDRGEKY